MKTEPVAGIQPALMKWARQSLGMSVEDVAARLKRSIEDIEAWESGVSAPTYPQLEKLAYEIYKRPLAVFFLPSPPEEAAPEHEFRSLPHADMQTLSPDTHLRIRRAHAYQLALRELFDNRNPADELIWRHVILKLDAPVSVQARAIREVLGISLDTQVEWKDDDSALKQWRQAIENTGIFVFKDSFKQKEISGFCLQDREFPLIYLNNSTTKTRQIFSLLHELAHLLLKKNGLSKFDKSYIEQLPPAEKQIEQFCNAIAAEILIPSSDFEQQSQTLPHDLDSMDANSITRNETLVNLLSRYYPADPITKRQNIIERRGEGVPKILSASTRLSLQRPKYEQIEGMQDELKLTIYAASKEMKGLVEQFDEGI